MQTCVAVKDEPLSDSEAASLKRRQNGADSNAADDDDGEGTASLLGNGVDVNDDADDADYDPGEFESAEIDVGTPAFRRFRKSRRLQKKPCCVTPVKKATRGGKNNNKHHNSNCSNNNSNSGKNSAVEEKKKMTCRPLRIMLRRSKTLGEPSARNKKKNGDDHDEQEERRDDDDGVDEGKGEDDDNDDMEESAKGKKAGRKGKKQSLPKNIGQKKTKSREDAGPNTSLDDLESATIVDIQSVRIIRQDGSEGE